MSGAWADSTPARPALRLGLVSALREEQQGLIEAMASRQTHTSGMREYTAGSLWGVDCVCVLSRIGKVAAAATTATLIERFGVTHVLFTGVAGGADPSARVGDIVVADSLVQHDMDASPLFPRFEVPLTGLSSFSTDCGLTDLVAEAARNFVGHDLERAVGAHDRALFRLNAPAVLRGMVASGDEFISGSTRLAELKSALPPLLAVEMEGAAVAQVCFEFGLPFAVVRTVSDGAGETAAHDFMRFVQSVASRYAFDIVRRVCLGLSGGGPSAV